MTFKEVFGAEGPISRIGSFLADVIGANLVWLVLAGPALMLAINAWGLGLPSIVWDLGEFSVSMNILGLLFPLVLMGPGTTAIFAALGKVQRKEESYLLKDFFKSYKQNFKQSLVTIPLLIFACMLIYSLWLEINNQALFGKILYVTIPLQSFLILELIFLFLYLFPLLARFEMPTKDLLKYSFMMANKHIPTTLICLALFLAVLALTFLWNLGIGVFGFGVYVYLSSFLFEKVFRNYMPEEDLDKDYLPEEIVAESTQVSAAVRRADEEAQKQMEADRRAIIDRYTKGKKD
ncbi:MAG: YesL family protein [Lachnospiraceae bacterium]|nr:YesL family protein [Lachnospiraceae bacterium]